jgi:hypothetical protein
MQEEVTPKCEIEHDIMRSFTVTSTPTPSMTLLRNIMEKKLV